MGTILRFASVPLRKMGTDLLGSWRPCPCASGTRALTRALPSAMPLRSLSPAVPASPSTLFVAPASAPAPTPTTPYTRLRTRWLTELALGCLPALALWCLEYAVFLPPDLRNAFSQ